LKTNLNTKLNIKKPRDVGDVIKYRARRSFELASRLHLLAVEGDNKVALGCADRLRVCGSSSNLWLGKDLHNEDGECFDGVGNLWHCRQIICPCCLPDRSRRMRRRVREGVSRVKLKKSELWRFLTLTCPALGGVPLVQKNLILNYAFSLLRKRKWWLDNFSAAIKSIEFTLGDEKRLKSEGRQWDFDVDGYNSHMHLLVASGWIAWKKLGEEWTLCLKKALRKFSYSDEIKTSHGRAVVDVRLVVDKKRNKSRNTITLDGAIAEVCKYMTKAESWLKVPDEQLLEVASVQRWGRMIELLGECREITERAESSCENSQNDDLPSILNALREAEGDLDETVKQVYKDSLAELEATRGTLFESQVKVSVAERLRTEASTYLDTQCLFDGSVENISRNLLSNRRFVIRDRGPSLRRLCLELPRDKWLKILYLRVSAVQTYRRRALIGRYQFAKFESLSGEKFGDGWGNDLYGSAVTPNYRDSISV
jgi:hypothetical protein